MQEHLYKCIVFLFLNYLKKQMSFNHLYLIEQPCFLSGAVRFCPEDLFML